MGIIARRYKLVTDLGKVLDPFSDTLARLTYFVCLISVSVMPVWVFIIMMYREFSIIFLRMLMMKTGKTVAANNWGKAKAVMYAISGIAGILYVSFSRLLERSGLEGLCRPNYSWIGSLSQLLHLLYH